jgi:hypothetical protein
MVQGELYPTGTNGDDNSMYLAFLDTIYTERNEAEYRAEHPESPDNIVAPVPDYHQLVNLMEERTQGSYIY